MIKFTIPGKPVPQGRPRASINRNPNAKRKIIMRDETKSRNFKEHVAWIASQYRPDELLKGPLALRVFVYREIPKNLQTKPKMALIDSGALRPTTKPDIDNYVKGIKDALNKIIWEDDSQIVDLHAAKFYSDNPRVEVEISRSGKGKDS